MKNFFKQKRVWIIISLSFSLSLILCSIIKIDYDIITPGYINKVESVIEIESDYTQLGSFNTTSVLVNERCSVLQYLLAHLSKASIIEETSEIVDNSDIRNSNSGVIQKNVSITNAIICAYKEAGKTIDYQYEGIIVHTLYVYATNDLNVGDIISKIDGQSFSNSEEFMVLYNNARLNPQYFDKEKQICSIPVTVNGVDKVITSNYMMTTSTGDIYPAFGFDYYDYHTIKEESASPSFTLNKSTTTGPSGGLMQTLAVFNALTEFDYTHGLTIAGTGTIEIDGTVGVIGGMYSKIFTAYYSGVDIFFVPYYESSSKTNYDVAMEAYRDLGSPSDFQIVPVQTFEEALIFLKNYGG